MSSNDHHLGQPLLQTKVNNIRSCGLQQNFLRVKFIRFSIENLLQFLRLTPPTDQLHFKS